jgi:hypothetical protein
MSSLFSPAAHCCIGRFAFFDPDSPMQEQPHPLFHAIPEHAGIATRIREHNHPDVLIMRAAMPAN